MTVFPGGTCAPFVLFPVAKSTASNLWGECSSWLTCTSPTAAVPERTTGPNLINERAFTGHGPLVGLLVPDEPGTAQPSVPASCALATEAVLITAAGGPERC